MKTIGGETRPGVQIPLPPPVYGRSPKSSKRLPPHRPPQRKENSGRDGPRPAAPSACGLAGRRWLQDRETGTVTARTATAFKRSRVRVPPAPPCNRPSGRREIGAPGFFAPAPTRRRRAIVLDSPGPGRRARLLFLFWSDLLKIFNRLPEKAGGSLHDLRRTVRDGGHSRVHGPAHWRNPGMAISPRGPAPGAPLKAGRGLAA